MNPGSRSYVGNVRSGLRAESGHDSVPAFVDVGKFLLEQDRCFRHVRLLPPRVDPRFDALFLSKTRADRQHR